MKHIDYIHLPENDKELFRMHTKVKFNEWCRNTGFENDPELFDEYLEVELKKTMFVESEGSFYYFIPKRLFT